MNCERRRPERANKPHVQKTRGGQARPTREIALNHNACSKTRNAVDARTWWERLYPCQHITHNFNACAHMFTTHLRFRVCGP